MAGVYYSNPFNSTYFTTCCRVAIRDSQSKCPRCQKLVVPFYDAMPDDERDQLTEHNVRTARARYAR